MVGGGWTHTHTQRDIYRQRQTEIYTQRDRQRQRVRQTDIDKHIQRQTYKERQRKTDRHIHIDQTDRQIDRHSGGGGEDLRADGVGENKRQKYGAKGGRSAGVTCD